MNEKPNDTFDDRILDDFELEEEPALQARMQKRWSIPAASPHADELASRLRTSPIIAQILLNRGLADPDIAREFLTPNLKHLHDPSLLPNSNVAAQRIAQAIRDKQKIVIYGDYDVDGITATSILWHAIKLLGGTVDYYIPHRIEEGYGLNSEAITQIIDAGAQLIISVDCGITAVDQAAIACSRNVDMIVTDHHEWHASEEGGAPILPKCFTIVHPRLPGHTPYPNPNLCGAGVAFKLAWAIGQAVSGQSRVDPAFREFLLNATAFAALGTIADVVPLTGENRILAHFGLSGLKQSKLIGIKALIASANLTGQKLDSYHVGFLLAPRLNASGRMGHAREAVEMMTVADEPRAIEIATWLETQNRNRQALERTVAEQAIKQCEELGYNSPDCRAIVLAAENWHPGVIGIVASRIVNKFHRPTFMISLSEGRGQGSGRSIPGFNLARALEACKEHLHHFGGHEMAAGLGIDPAKVAAFREAFNAYAQEVLKPEHLQPTLHLDSLALLPHLTEALVKDLQRLGPFGQANPKPLLYLENLEVAFPPRVCGKSGDHLQLHIRQNGRSMKCIAFKRANMLDQLKPGTRLDLAVEPQINEFNGMRNVELEIKDLRVK